MSSTGPAAAQAAAEQSPSGDPLASRDAGPAALRGSALRSAGYVATVLLSLVSAPLLIRHLGLAEFGRYTTVIALVTIVGGLTDGGLLSVAMREWATHSGRERVRLMQGLLGVRIELTAVGVVAGVAFALAAGYEEPMVLGSLIAGIGMGVQVVANLLTVGLQGDLRFGWASVVDVCRQGVATMLIVALVLAGAGLIPFFAVTVPAAVTALGMSAHLVRRRMPLVPRFGRDEHWALIRDTLPYALAIAVNTLYFRVTIVAMSLMASTVQTGYFATSFRVTEVLVGVPAIAVGTVFPVISRAAGEDRARFAYAGARIFELAMIAGVGVALVVALVAPFAVDVLAGRAGAPAAPVLEIQGLSLMATFIAAASGYLLLSLRRNRAMLIASCCALAANLALTLALVPVAQAQGAAVAAVVAEGSLALAQTVLLLRTGRLRLDARALGLVLAAGLVGAVPLFTGGLPALTRTCAGGALYLAALVALRRFPPELWQALRHRVPRGR